MRILVIEDDAATNAYLVNGLREIGHVVDAASGPASRSACAPSADPCRQENTLRGEHVAMAAAVSFPSSPARAAESCGLGSSRRQPVAPGNT
jgi:CheY-like chemotaxis protein